MTALLLVSTLSLTLVADPYGNCLLVHGLVKFGVGLAGEQCGRNWLLARHLGRAALVSTHGSACSCLMAKRLADAFGHACLDWVMILGPVALQTFFPVGEGSPIVWSLPSRADPLLPLFR